MSSWMDAYRALLWPKLPQLLHDRNKLHLVDGKGSTMILCLRQITFFQALHYKGRTNDTLGRQSGRWKGYLGATTIVSLRKRADSVTPSPQNCTHSLPHSVDLKSAQWEDGSRACRRSRQSPFGNECCQSRNKAKKQIQVTTAVASTQGFPLVSFLLCSNSDVAQ
jgi:hypothetical protein